MTKTGFWVTLSTVIIAYSLAFLALSSIHAEPRGSAEPTAVKGTAPTVAFEEKRLARILDDVDSISDFSASPDGKIVAYMAKKDKKKFLILGGKKGEEFEYVDSFTESSNHKVFAYRAAKKSGVKKVSMVVGDKKSEEYDGLGIPFISPDGRTVAYWAELDGKQFVVLGDKKGEPFDVVGEPFFSPDWKVMAHIAKRGKSMFMVVGGKKGEAFDGIGPGAFSPDGKGVAYPAVKDGKMFMVIGDQKGEVFEGVGPGTFSPDGKLVAYPAGGPGKLSMIAGNKKSAVYDWIGAGVFSPDGKTLAYPFKIGNVMRMAVGEKIGEGFEKMGAPIFSPDGRRVAYPAGKGEKKFVVVGDTIGEEYDGIGLPSFSPDGKVVAYPAKKGTEWFVVVGDKPGEAYEFVGNVFFSPDGRTVAYQAYDGKEQFVVIDGRKVDGTYQVGDPLFSPDGRKVGFEALQHGDIWWRVVNVDSPGRRSMVNDADCIVKKEDGMFTISNGAIEPMEDDLVINKVKITKSGKVIRLNGYSWMLKDGDSSRMDGVRHLSMHEGKMMIRMLGREAYDMDPMTQDMVLVDGSKVSMSGTYTGKDGSSEMLTEDDGEIDPCGNDFFMPVIQQAQTGGSVKPIAGLELGMSLDDFSGKFEATTIIDGSAKMLNEIYAKVAAEKGIPARSWVEMDVNVKSRPPWAKKIHLLFDDRQSSEIRLSFLERDAPAVRRAMPFVNWSKLSQLGVFRMPHETPGYAYEFTYVKNQEDCPPEKPARCSEIRLGFRKLPGDQ